MRIGDLPSPRSEGCSNVNRSVLLRRIRPKARIDFLPKANRKARTAARCECERHDVWEPTFVAQRTQHTARTLLGAKGIATRGSWCLTARNKDATRSKRRFESCAFQCTLFYHFGQKTVPQSVARGLCLMPKALVVVLVSFLRSRR